MNVLDIIDTHLERKGVAYACIAHKCLHSALTYWGPRLRHEDANTDPLDQNNWLSSDNDSLRVPYGSDPDAPNTRKRFMECVEAFEAFSIASMQTSKDRQWDIVMSPINYTTFIGANMSNSNAKERSTRTRRRADQVKDNPILQALYDANAAKREKRSQVDNERLKEDLPWALGEVVGCMSLSLEQFDQDRGLLVDGMADKKYDPASDSYKTTGMTVEQAYERLIKPKPAFEDACISKILDRIMSDHAWMDDQPDFETLAFFSLQDILYLGIELGINPLKDEHKRTITQMRELSLKAQMEEVAQEAEERKETKEDAPFDDDISDI